MLECARFLILWGSALVKIIPKLCKEKRGGGDVFTNKKGDAKRSWKKMVDPKKHVVIKLGSALELDEMESSDTTKVSIDDTARVTSTILFLVRKGSKSSRDLAPTKRKKTATNNSRYRYTSANRIHDTSRTKL